MAQYVQFVAEGLGPTTNYQNKIFSYILGHPGCSGESLNATEREHTLVLLRCVPLRFKLLS